MKAPISPSCPSHTCALTDKRKTVACERKEATLVTLFSSIQASVRWYCPASRVPVSAVVLLFFRAVMGPLVAVILGPLVVVVVRYCRLVSFFL